MSASERLRRSLAASARDGADAPPPPASVTTLRREIAIQLALMDGPCPSRDNTPVAQLAVAHFAVRQVAGAGCCSKTFHPHEWVINCRSYCYRSIRYSGRLREALLQSSFYDRP